MLWSNVIGKGRGCAVIQGPRFLPSCASPHLFWVLRAVPSIFHMWQQLGGEREWRVTQNLKGQIRKWQTSLLPSFHWPELSTGPHDCKGEWEICPSHVLRRKCMVPTPSRPSVHLLSSSGLFWDQDLSLLSSESYPWKSLVFVIPPEHLRHTLMALVFFIINLQVQLSCAKPGPREMT